MTSCVQFCRDDSSVHNYQLFQNRRHRQDEFTNGLADTRTRELDAMLSSAFNRLTFQERQEQQNLLHGVDDEIQEDDTLIRNSLQDLEDHLRRIKRGSAYEQAEKMDPTHVGSRSLRMMFLRGNRYDIKAAADQMIRFFKMKQQIFGTEKLVKDITIEDLDEDDLECLRSGSMQIAYKDQSNRPILFEVPGLRTYKSLKNELRVRYFVIMKMMEPEEAQRRGAIAITYLVGQYKDSTNGEGFADHHNLSMALPLYPAAFHVCTDEWAQAALGNVVIRIMPATQRARFRLHFGTHLECQYKLASYGIAGSLLPFVPETNTIDLEPHLQWCQKCVSNDGFPQLVPDPSPSGPITEPNPFDVLSLGSTKSDNIGNDRLRELVKENLEAYSAGSSTDKRHIVDNIISDIHGVGGRFLQQEKGSLVWNVLPLSKARVKIAQRFRNLNRRRETASEQARRDTLITGAPLANDVIFGKTLQKTEGTLLLHHLVKERLEEYESMNRGMKVVVVDAIIERITNQGGRFLQPTPDLQGYVELLSADSIRTRISTYFRNHRRLLKRKMNNS